MLRISNKQRAIINLAVKPFKITSNYLGTGLQNLIKYYTKYFSKRRYSIVHLLPAYKNSRNNVVLTVLFNSFVQKGGFATIRRPLTWNFYGNVLQTKYGRKKQRKEIKKERKKARLQKSNDATDKQSDVEIIEDTIATHSTVSESNENNQDETIEANTTVPAAHPNSTVTQDIPNNTSEKETEKEKIDLDDEIVNNIWNLDIQKVAALITETDENQLSESINGNVADNSNEISAAKEISHDLEQREQSCVDEESQNKIEETSKSSGGDINEKIRQQLKLLKMGKSENFLFTPKESSRLTTSTRSTTSLYRRSISNVSNELSTNNTSLRKSTNILNVKPTAESIDGSPKESENPPITSRSTNDTEDGQKPKSIGGMIDSLFSKFQSINSNIKTKSSSSMATAPTKRSKRDDTLDNLLFASFDSNQDDSNQSAASISMEFLGFDISNKNVDVSALLPTPKVPTSNNQAAFVSEYLDMFMKENSLEKNNDQVTFTPKHCSTDEALMTTDALPPNLSVPARPTDMQRPRTLAEKRMILQQQTDISIFIIENESTVYHELKKRVKQGSSYDNALMRSIQDASIPFTRDCWKAACWISTSNNRFFYRTILCDGQEIKLTGGRGDNTEKVAFELKCENNKIVSTNHSLKHIQSECSKKCSPIDGIKINNIDSVLNENKVKPDEGSHTKEKYGLLKKSRLCMFSREYLTPGPKSQKVKCKANRKSSFDLEYGPLELVQLPTVQLEVWPQVGMPLSDHIKPILKTIPTNSNVITPEWAKFAVSVVREAPKQPKHRRKYKKPELERPQPIVFTIPYENNEKKILIRKRRRSSIVFNKDDTVNEHIELFYEDETKQPFSFNKSTDPSDKLSVECADILGNMIESIAIAVNDTNFIKDDPDIDYIGKVVPVSALKDTAKGAGKAEKDKQNAKSENASKNKLIKELKRLNVTVIDTVNEMAKSKADETCQKSFCKYGCVCGSINTAKYIQTNCQRPECMFECVCVNTPFKKRNTFYLNNNLDVLQARANACLAKEEKEFKSTIVVSENDMFVLPNSSTASKRSSKKPKRFTNDESYLEDAETETIFKSKRRRPAEKVVEKPATISTAGDDRQRFNFIKSVQHVRVEMKRLPELVVEPWCLVHCLYKCHCKGRAQKGRIFNFANKKNDSTAPGGWDIISPRKRQYTFERENATATATATVTCGPAPKSRKVCTTEETEQCTEVDSSARTNEYSWKMRQRRTPQELKMLRNECMFAEDQKIDLLNQRIMMCRKYNQAQNMLTKSMENGKLVSKTKSNTLTNGHISTLSRSSNESLQRLNQVITDTMHRLTALQERSQLSLNPTPNKLSIVPWDRILQAFISREVFVWDVILKDNMRLLVLTMTHTKPKSDSFLHVTNINYSEDINALPMIAKLLRDQFQSDRTKYLAMLLLRITYFWRICGVLHSDLKYMDDELRAKPTPDQNPLLGRKINTLYQLLTTRQMQKTQQIQITQQTVNNSEATVSPEPANDLLVPTTERTEPNPIDDSNKKDSPKSDSKLYFENSSMRLYLPIPVEPKQRLLMINVGDDFTHVWFPTWHKFLSAKRIHNSFILAKKMDKAIEMSQSINDPKVFVSNSHDNCIFIGPYGSNDRQNLALFVKHNNHMLLSELYYRKHGRTYTRKTKASWVYPSSAQIMNLSHPKQSNSVHFKIDQVFSTNDLPSEIVVGDPSSNDGEIASTSTDQPVRSGFFTIASISNGSNTIPIENDGASKSTPKIFIPTKIVEKTPTQLASKNVISSADQNQNPLPLKISSVASGEEVTLMTNGFDDTDDIDTQPQISKIELLKEVQNDKTNSDSTVNKKNDRDSGDFCDFSNSLLIEMKTEAIDISDDEQNNEYDVTTSEVSPKIKEPSDVETSDQLKGYIYCSTNIQLGKIDIEWTDTNHVKLHLSHPIDIDCGKANAFQDKMACITSYMTTYIRERFYGIYPAYLELDWIFIKVGQDEPSGSNLGDFNKTNPFSVVFKDKIVKISSSYRDDTALPIKDLYVLDIYHLASQLFPEDFVKQKNISEILKESRRIDAELIAQQIKLKKQIIHWEKLVERYDNIFSEQLENQNGNL